MHEGVAFSELTATAQATPGPSTYHLSPTPILKIHGLPLPNSCLFSHLPPQGFPQPFPTTPDDGLTEGPTLP